MWPIRTMLFIPATKVDWVRKVDRFDPDAVVLDLEDAVPPGMKDAACESAREAIAVLRQKRAAAFVRINALAGRGALDVPRIVVDGLAGIMLPKAHPEEVRELDLLLSHAEGAAGLPRGTVRILPTPETARGLWEARALAQASERCDGILGVVSGGVSGDVAGAVGLEPSMEGAEQLYLASKMVLDSRAGGAPWPMCSVIGTALDDLDGVRMIARRCRALGYTGLVLIHPAHVAVAREVFTPTREEVDYFAGLVEAMREAEARGDGAVSYRGTMVDYAMIPKAEAVLRDAERLGVQEAS